jgi:4-hydroxy-3-polyprenylbenzoate decarboxylase
MVTATEIGAIICPPMPAFYQRPTTIEQLIDHTVMRVLDLFGITLPEELSGRWQGAKDRAIPK